MTLPIVTSSSLLASSSFGVEASLAGVGVGDVLPASAAAIASGLVAVDELESAMIDAPEVWSEIDRDGVVEYG